MTQRSFLTFDIHADFGHFKKPFTTMSMQTYDVPTGTAIIGMIGAILGLDKNSYWERFTPGSYTLAIGVRKPVTKVWIPFNTLKTGKKPNKSFHQIDQRKQSNMQFLKDCHYRIWFSSGDDNLMDELETLLKEHQSVYSTCMGLAWCLSDFTYIGRFDSSAIEHSTVNPDGQQTLFDQGHDTLVNIDSIVPRDCLLECSFDNRKILNCQLPIAMKDNSRVLSNVRPCIVETTGKSITGKIVGGLRLNNGDIIVPLL